MLHLSTQTESTAKHFGIDTAVSMICDAGFEAIDLSLFDLLQNTSPFFGDNYFEVARRIKKTASERGVFFNQAHAPFPSYRVGDEEYNKIIKPALIKAMRIASEVGADQIIVHPVYLEENKKEFNMELYGSLEPYCRDLGIKVALENMFKTDRNGDTVKISPNVCSVAEEFKDFVSSLDNRYFTACLDIGHCGLVGETTGHMIETLCEHLTALHIHDNDGLRDIHTMPFTMSVNFKEVAKSLKKIGYKGDLTLEADGFLRKMPTELWAEGLCLMRAADAHLRNLINNA